MQNNKRYYDLNSYLKERFRCKVYKITVDAGLTCPNRDGTISKGGCIYCLSRGPRPQSINPPIPIKEQIIKGKEFLSKTRRARKFIVYFQPYSNTYAPLEKLKKIYDEAFMFKDIVGISIGTRPDCVSDEILDLLEEYAKTYTVWVEYGLQSIHENTLKKINRGHGLKEFTDAVNKTRVRNIHICTHVIIGLPQEGREDVIETAKFLADLKIDGVKIHLLFVVDGTVLGNMYNEGKIKILRMEEAVSLICDFLEHLHPSTVIHRLTGDPPRDKLIAPLWSLNKLKVINAVNKELKKRDSYQGIKLKPNFAAL
jgi:radical SAM protein (TIGR01212 family)